MERSEHLSYGKTLLKQPVLVEAVPTCVSLTSLSNLHHRCPEDRVTPRSYLEVPVHDAHSVQVVDGIQDLPDQGAGVLLGVEPFLNNPVEKLSPRHSGKHDGRQKCEDMLRNVFSTSLKDGQGHALATGSPRLELWELSRCPNKLLVLVFSQSKDWSYYNGK